ncbi:MAG TPA: hypothetical protein VGN51_07910 [Acidimicrobiia bacterium]|jgi:hypothetical protein
MMRVVAVCELTVLGLVLVLVVPNARAFAASDAATSARVSAEPASARPGDRVVVHLDGWSPGTVTVGVCGNDARRGAQDCALVGDQSVAVRNPGTTLVDLTLVQPPAPCPCVIRALTPSLSYVTTSPIELVGVPVAPVVGPAPAAAVEVDSGVRVHAAVVEAPVPGWQVFGGTGNRVLAVTIDNGSADALEDLRVVAAVGRGRGSGEPLPSRAVRRIGAGVHRTVRIPFTVSAPFYGDYTVAGTVYGLPTATAFHADLDNDPWAAELLLPIALLVLAETLRVRDRRARRREAAADAAVAATPIAAIPLAPLTTIITEPVDLFADASDAPLLATATTTTGMDA